MNGWRDGEDVYVSIGGTGSISCRGITEDEGLERERRKQPIGFRLPEPSAKTSRYVTVPDATWDPDDPWELGRVRQSLIDKIGDAWGNGAISLENEGRGWGEALWTARDIAGL